MTLSRRSALEHHEATFPLALLVLFERLRLLDRGLRRLQGVSGCEFQQEAAYKPRAPPATPPRITPRTPPVRAQPRWRLHEKSNHADNPYGVMYSQESLNTHLHRSESSISHFSLVHCRYATSVRDDVLTVGACSNLSNLLSILRVLRSLRGAQHPRVSTAQRARADRRSMPDQPNQSLNLPNLNANL